jgi:hypothetical protein
MFEHRDEPVISRRRFAFRVAASLGIGVAINALAIVIGAVGYHALEGIDWLTACVNAAMVVTGNGLVTQLHTSGGKVFSIVDAILGVLVFMLVASVVLAPVIHRLLHRFHRVVQDKSLPRFS